MGLSVYKVLDLLEAVNSASHYENEILTTAGILDDLVDWVHIWGRDKEGAGVTEFLPWLHREARRYEASTDDGSAADYRGPEYYEWLNEQGRQIRAKIEEGY